MNLWLKKWKQNSNSQLFKVELSFICHKCKKEQSLVGIIVVEENVYSAGLSFEDGALIFNDWEFQETIGGGEKSYFCWDCGEKLTEKEIISGALDWLEKHPSEAIRFGKKIL